MGKVTRYAYDGGSQRLASITDALGHVAVTLAYNQAEQVSSRTDARGLLSGAVTTMSYTAAASASPGPQTTREVRVASGWAATWQPTIVHVYEQARLVSVTTDTGPGDDPEVLTWTWSPDSQTALPARAGGTTPVPSGTPVSVPTGPLGGSSIVVGDPDEPLPSPRCIAAPPPTPRAGDLQTWAALTSKTDPRRATFQPLTAAAQTAIGRTLDGFGHLTALETSEGTWRIDYDADDRPQRLEAPASAAMPGAIEVAYDAVGNVVSIQRPNGDIDTFAYDERDALIEARWSSGVTARYLYDERGDLARATLVPPNGAAQRAAEYAHDGLHGIRRFTLYPQWPDTSQSQVIEYGYDATGGCAGYTG